MKTFQVSMMAMVMALALAACGGSSKKKGSTSSTAAAASMSKQKAGSAATGAMSKATNSGADSGGVTCDGSLEGVGFCASDAQIVFCAGGSWYALDCSAVAEGAYCGTDESSGAIDCYQ